MKKLPPLRQGGSHERGICRLLGQLRSFLASDTAGVDADGQAVAGLMDNALIAAGHVAGSIQAGDGNAVHIQHLGLSVDHQTAEGQVGSQLQLADVVGTFSTLPLNLARAKSASEPAST